MDNKNEKTFADLFSSSTTEENDPAQSLNDILNNNDKEETRTVTFDSLFEQTSGTDEPRETSSVENKSEEVSPEEPEEMGIPENETSEETKNTFSFNSIFQDVQDDNFVKDLEKDLINKPIEVDEETKSENNKIEEPIEIQTEFNPFFEEKENTNSDIKLEDNSETETTFTTEKTEINPETEEKEKIENNDEIESNNLFAQTDNDDEEDKTKDLVENKESFTNNDFKEQTQDITPDIDNNPFMNNDFSSNEQPTEKNIEISSSPALETNIEIAPIFKETKEPEEMGVNPFLEINNESLPTESILEIQKENNANIASKEKELNENLVPQSTSPFFEEEQKNEENPFFQNQINLIENQVPNNPNTNIDTSKSKHYNVKIVKKKEPLTKFILGVLSYALFIWLLLIGITLLVYVLDIKIRAAKGDYSAPTFNAYVVLTGSMLPEIKVYDVVVTKKVDVEKLKEGDVITFASADSRFLGTIITHRIIKKNPPSGTEGYTFQTKGDNNNVADSALVPEKNIYGKVILKIPKLGYLQEFLASDGGWIIVILIPCLTVISYDIVKLLKGLKRKKYKNIKVQK